jgi:hypothetical protein
MASDPPGAQIIVDGNPVGATPMDVSLKRKRDHLVTFQKDGYRPQSVAVVKDVGGAVWGNILLGGFIGWGVDAATGAQYNLTPKALTVTLEREADSPTSSDAPAADSDAATFVARLNTLDELRDNEQISDEEYAKAKLALFQQYMPEALPEDQRNPAGAVPAAAGKADGPRDSSAESATPAEQDSVSLDASEGKCADC